jgi:hypothetical protein
MGRPKKRAFQTGEVGESFDLSLIDLPEAARSPVRHRDR